eukprot:COSAG02_NODE_469_length_21727_cov_64.506334_14_plen_68_part_00
MTAREPKDLRELYIPPLGTLELTSQTPVSSNIIPPDNKRNTAVGVARFIEYSSSSSWLISWLEPTEG